MKILTRFFVELFKIVCRIKQMNPKFEEIQKQKEEFVNSVLSDFDAWFEKNSFKNQLANLNTKQAEDIMMFKNPNFSETKE